MTDPGKPEAGEVKRLALEKLRMAIDDNLVWRDDAQQEAGDYEGTVEYSGELATECLELREQLRAQAAEREALVAVHNWAWESEQRGYWCRRELQREMGKLAALRSQPTPTGAPVAAVHYHCLNGCGADVPEPMVCLACYLVATSGSNGTGQVGTEPASPPLPGEPGQVELVIAACKRAARGCSGWSGDVLLKLADELKKGAGK